MLIESVIKPRHLAIAAFCLLAARAQVSAQAPLAPDLEGRAEAALARIRDLELVELEVPLEPRRFETRLRVGGETMTLRLTPHSNRAAGFKVVLRGADGKLEVVEPGPVRTVRGTIDEIPGARVSGVLGVKGLDALIRLPDEIVLQVEPVARHLQGGLPGQHAIYNCERLQPEASGQPSCATSHLRLPEPGLELAHKTGSNGQDCAYLGTCVARIILDTDTEFSANFNNNIQAIQDHLELMLEWTNSRYEPDFHITHQLERVMIRTDTESDPYADISDPGLLLGKVHDVWNNPPNHTADLVHLFTGKSVGFGGLSYTSGVCGTGFPSMESFAVDSIFSCQRAGRMMHELGHNWGSPDLGSGMMNTFTHDCNSAWLDAAPLIEAKRDTVDQSCLDLLESPQIRVQSGASVVPNGGTFNYGTRLVGSANNATFLLANDGDSDLLSSNLTVPAGYSITTALPPTLPPASSGNFAVQLNATAAGTFNGDIQFVNNDPDDDPFVIHARGIVIAPNSLSPAWVDFAYTGDQYGTQTQPFKTLALAAEAVTVSGEVRLKAGSTNEIVTINKAMTLVADNGPVIIGQ